MRLGVFWGVDSESDGGLKERDRIGVLCSKKKPPNFTLSSFPVANHRCPMPEQQQIW